MESQRSHGRKGAKGGQAKGVRESGSGKAGRGKAGRGKAGQPELSDFSIAYVCSANSANWLVLVAAGTAARSFLGRPRTQCRPNCSETALTNFSSPNGRPA